MSNQIPTEPTQEIKIYYVDVNQLISATYNPRKWDESANKQLTESIKRFGVVDPIIVNGAEERLNIVIGGHCRLKVAKQLGITTIPVVYIKIPDVEKEKELNLRFNRNTGEWDLELLKSFDIGLLLDVGFDDGDLSHIWDENLGVEDDDFDVKKAIQEIKNPKTKLGNLILLGDHRLICGDSSDPKFVQRLVGADKVQMLNFDPIYNINLNYSNGIGTKGKYGGKATDKKSDIEYKAFLKTIFQNGLSYITPDCHVFCWCDETYIGLIQDLYTELGITNKRVCLWIKNNANITPQIAFNKVYEPCVYGTIGNPYLFPSLHNLSEVLNKEVGTGNRLCDDIMDLFNIWLVKRVNCQDYEHPTQKPPTLYEKAFRRCTKPGDIILDLFGGSGSQLIAAEQLKRRALLCEIDPVFCDVIVARYTELTGKETIYVDPKE
mgnify:CR=1 FL=1